MLDLDSEEAPAAAAKYAKLDAIIEDAKNQIKYDATLEGAGPRRKQAERILAQIDDVLTEHNVLYPAGDYDVESLRAALAPQRYDKTELERVLKVEVNARRRSHARAHADEAFFIADCDIASILYVAIGQVCGLEIHLVDLPDHMFVRWELGGNERLNWDTVDAEVVSDKEYAADYHLKRGIRKKRVYLASMTTREAEGFVYFLRSGRYETKGEDAKAIADLEKAKELYPQATQVAAELAWLYATAVGVDEAKRKSAVGLAQSALDLEPKCGDFWDSLAAAQAANGDFKAAVRSAEKAERYAESSEDRATFKAHRVALERGLLPTGGRAKAKADDDDEGD
jgi:tetratricopeptide (TPR) repeat protein